MLPFAVVETPTLVMLFAGAAAASAVSGMTGLGGGVLLLSLLASTVETAFVVPLHAAVQLLSNGARVSLFAGHVRWPVVGLFALGMLPGALLGIGVFSLLDERLIKLGMGFFILAAIFIPLGGGGREGRFTVFVPVGFAAGFFGVFFGSVGPLIARFFLRDDFSRQDLVGTKAACQALGHLARIPLFGLIGVNVLRYAPLLGWLALAVLVGTLLGKRLLHLIPERAFRLAFRVLLSLIALRLIVAELMKPAG